MKSVDVAVGVVLDDAGQVLLARRPDALHQGGKLEFPGGKIEPGESLAHAMQREFLEEVNLELHVPNDLAPWQVIEHDYGDKQVRLMIALVTSYSGTPSGNEGQDVFWQPVAELNAADFPAANVAIIDKLQQHLGVADDRPMVDEG